MNLTRIYGSLALAAIIAQKRLQRRRRADRRDGATAPLSSASAYTGPAPATSDVQAFARQFLEQRARAESLRQCHNATSPAQMPNFARSDDVNLAYAQANTVVNLQQPSTFPHRRQGERADTIAG